ncbi:hypothetical protein [Xanthomonas vesicatoria]|uniref:hypothetical protein n=1 Tax=Xanthomonas vesicatoria TaxID=56460 RepID=UPI0013E08A46|nr:hypothetical protein [Xanthomonas vesicatoria]
MGEAGAEQQHGEKQSTHEGLQVGAVFGFFVDAAALLLLFAVCCLLFAVCCLLFAVAVAVVAFGSGFAAICSAVLTHSCTFAA